MTNPSWDELAQQADPLADLARTREALRGSVGCTEPPLLRLAVLCAHTRAVHRLRERMTQEGVVLRGPGGSDLNMIHIILDGNDARGIYWGSHLLVRLPGWANSALVQDPQRAAVLASGFPHWMRAPVVDPDVTEERPRWDGLTQLDPQLIQALGSHRALYPQLGAIVRYSDVLSGSIPPPYPESSPHGPAPWQTARTVIDQSFAEEWCAQQEPAYIDAFQADGKWWAYSNSTAVMAVEITPQLRHHARQLNRQKIDTAAAPLNTDPNPPPQEEQVIDVPYTPPPAFMTFVTPGPYRITVYRGEPSSGSGRLTGR